ncbi:MAG: hypothetical protein Q7S02_04280 [bacterium]|nr:hypothetical protein [bacterium]
MTGNRRLLLAIAPLFTWVALLPSPADASSPDLLISDREFTHAEAMSIGDIHTFFQERSSLLATTFVPDSDGALKFPTEVIWLAAQEARINPKVLLTTLQKEQRLVTDPQPSPRQLDFAMGYGCPDGSGCSDRFRGFGKQMRGAALQFRGYLDDLATKGETIARWAVGRARSTGDGFEIAPKNAATAALYSYTPWRGGVSTSRIGGNTSFSRIWKEWFGGGAWPDGTILETPDGARWLLEGGKRRLLATPAVVAIRSASASIVRARMEEIETYAAGASVKFTDYTVVESSGGIRWLLIGTQRRKIASREVFRKLGFNPEEVDTISADDLAPYTEGPTIDRVAADPRGALVEERGTKKVFLVVGTTKQPLLDPLIQRFIAGNDRPVLRTAKELQKLKTIAPARLPDGAIVTSPKALPTVFIISHGERRAFGSPRALELLGYQWSDVRHVTNAALDLHPPGLPIDDGSALEIETQRQPSITAPSPPLPPRPRYLSGLSVF